MKSIKRMLIGAICGLLCSNGVSLAEEVSNQVVNTEKVESSTSTQPVVDDTKSSSDDFISIKILDNGKTIQGVESSNPCCQNVYNLSYVPSPEVDKAMLNFVNKSTELMTKIGNGVLDKFNEVSFVDESKKVVNPDEKDNADISNEESISFPYAVLKVTDELTKPVFYRTSYDKLSKIAKDFLGDSSKASLIETLPENASVISKMVKKDKLPDGETLYIPQPGEGEDWLLCNVTEGENFYSLAQKYYGSWEYARLLGEFNDHAYNLSDSIYKKVVKLPRVLSFSKYVVTSDDTTLSRLCEKLLGSPIYDRPVASLNGLDINSPLQVGSSIYIPTLIKYDGPLKK